MIEKIEIKNQSVINITSKEKLFLESALQEMRKLLSNQTNDELKSKGEITFEFFSKGFRIKPTGNIWVEHK